MRLAEFGTVYRYEQSGELGGLTRKDTAAAMQLLGIRGEVDLGGDRILV